MSAIPTSFANAGQPLYVPYYAASSNAQNLTVSTLLAQSISTTNLEVISGNIGLSAGTFISTIGNQLFFYDGTFLEPLATISSISSIADWAFEPAITNVDMAGNDIENANVIDAGYISTLLLDAEQAEMSSIKAYSIECEIFTATSTIQNFNYISTQNLVADTLVVSTINGYTVGDFLSSSALPSSITVSSLTVNLGLQSTAVIQGEVVQGNIPPYVDINAPYSVNLTMGVQNVTNDFPQAGQLNITGGLYVADPAQSAFGARFQGASDTSYNFTITPTKNLIVQPNNNDAGMIIATFNDPGDNKGLTLSNFEVLTPAQYQQTLFVTPGPIIQTDGGFSVGNNLLAGSNVQVSTINGYTVSDFLSTSASQYDPNPQYSTIIVKQFISTPDLEVSTINGHQFTENTAIISSLITNNISSLTGDIQFQLVSTLGFSLGSNEFSLGGVNLGLGNILGQITGGALGILGAATGVVGLGTGVAALTQTRGTQNINTNNYELVNGTTQLQVSTVGEYISSIYRFNSGNPPNQEIGQEVFVSTIYPPGSVLLRSFSDPLNTASTPLSTIQAFGEWVSLPVPAMSSIADWSFEPALSNVDIDGYDITQVGNIDIGGNLFGVGSFFSTVSLGTSTILRDSDFSFSEFQVLNNNYSTSQICVSAVRIAQFPEQTNTGGYSYSRILDRAFAFTSSLEVRPIAYLQDLSNLSTFENVFTSNLNAVNISTSLIALTGSSAIEFRVNDGTNINQGALTVDSDGTMSLVADMPSSEVSVPSVNTDGIGAKNNPFIELKSDLVQVPGLTIAGDTISSINSYATAAAATTISSGQVSVSSISVRGLPNSTITIGTAATAGAQLQPAGRLVMTGQDLDVGQNDIWVQQIHCGAGNSGAVSEVIMYQPDNGTKRFNVQSADRTIRVTTSALGLAAPGYLLDTFVNTPFFSTINNQTNMMSFFPSTNSATIGVSTISIIPNFVCSAYSSTSQTVAGANTLTLLTHNTTTTNVGGFTVLGSTITVPVGGLYEINTSIQFDTTTLGTNLASFWLRKNGSNVPATGSLVSVTGQGETLGNITLIDSANANDQYTVAIQSADANMTAARFAAAGNIPEIPSIITNIKKIG